MRFFRWRCLLYLQAAATKRTSKPIPPTHPREALKLKLRTRLRLRRTPLHRKQIPNPHPLKRQKQIRLQAEQQPSVSVGKFAFIKDKKGDILRSDSESKIWAGVVGDAYILLRNTSDANEWGEKGRIYELHCAQFAGKYSMWSDGYWELNDDGTELTLTPKNQSENGNIGVAAGKSKTFKGQNGVFSVPVTFEQGGKTTIKIDFNKVSK